MLKDGGLEGALSRLRGLSSLLREGQEISGMTAERARSLDDFICKKITDSLDLGAADLIPVRRFAAWVKRSRYEMPIEIFTTNYDLLLETALDQQSALYFDGFSGVIEARLQTELIEASKGNDVDFMPSFFARVWKLHGSVNWIWKNGEIVRLGRPLGGQVAAIYPSHTKYDQSRRYPFVVLQDKFRRSVNEPESIIVVSGYSFGDQHLNEIIYDAASRRERSETIVFTFDPIPDDLAERASYTPNLQIIGRNEAVIGGRRAPWKAPDEESDYWIDGTFSLPDFNALSRFFAKSYSKRGMIDPSISDLLVEFANTLSSPEQG